MIGLTGAYCAGKNYIGQLLTQRSYEVIDIDRIGHQVLDERRSELGRRWPACLDAEGNLNRRALGALVFGQPAELAALEAIVHPAVDERLAALIEGRDDSRIVLNAALLHRSVFYSRLNLVILVQAPSLLRFFRALKRDKLPLARIMDRISAQKDFNTQYFQSAADIIIVRNWSDGCLFRRFADRQLQRRLDLILAHRGMVR